jgi:hypothetical protein
MLHSRSTTLLILPLWVTLLWFTLFWTAPLLAYGQAADQGPAQNSPSSASSRQSSQRSIQQSIQQSKPVQSDQPTAPAAEPIPADAERMSRQTRLEIIRDFETQLVYSRATFPMNTKGLRLRGDEITPNGDELRQALALWGPAIKPGDPAHISLVQIKDDHIHLEINGGPVRRQKWYKHIQVSGTHGSTVTPGGDEPQKNPHGSFLDVYFAKHVPEMTAQQLRALLFPVLDFNARSKEQAYLDTVPPKVKEAILAHRVLVGMNQEMVLHAKGKPPQKVRERDGETQYEEWIYGEAPADVDFVRMVGDEVVRVETIKVSGEKIVRTEREIALPPSDKDKGREAKKEPEARPANRPSLRRPGEDPIEETKPAGGTAPLPPVPPPPDLPQPPGGPGEIAGTR